MRKETAIAVKDLRVGQKFHTSESETVYTAHRVHAETALTSVQYTTPSMGSVWEFAKPSLSTVYVIG